MAYQPTGKPPGRPKTKPEPKAEVKSVEPLHSPFHVLPVTAFADRPCAECWPGVTKFHALTCEHGTFLSKRQ